MADDAGFGASGAGVVAEDLFPVAGVAADAGTDSAGLPGTAGVPVSDFFSGAGEAGPGGAFTPFAAGAVAFSSSKRLCTVFFTLISFT